MSQPPLKTFIEQVLATAQAGLTYTKDPFDKERFLALQDAAAHWLADSSGLDSGAIRDWIALDSGYPTPKLDVRALILDAKGDLLLVRERCDGLWTLPGGWCDIGESPREAVERELREETGLVCTATRLLALFDKHKHPHPPQIPHSHKAFFLCQVEGGALLRQTSETLDAAYFPCGELPPLSEHRVLATQIRLLHERVVAGIEACLFD